ncbi:MAG TPA: endonuclease/exonuclease/phosphatase family protein [Steroidobacteraceae bacterium]
MAGLHAGVALAQAPAPATLKLATWNLEWLIEPSTFRKLRSNCAPESVPLRRGERRLPCDVARRFERSSADFDALAKYAERLDADVIALQEVDGPSAARMVFRAHEFCFTRAKQIQNNGFAIRKGIPFRCGPDLQALSLGDSVRRGAQVTLFPGEPRELRLLSVHLKSGCNRDLLNTRKDACRQLALQVPQLEAWIDAQARANRPFAVLGDFNRILLRDQGPARSARGEQLRLWPEIDDGDPPGADLVNAADGQPYVNCTPGQSFAGYVDAIVLGAQLGNRLVPGSFHRVTYSASDAHRFRLSDHCPIAVRIRLP